MFKWPETPSPRAEANELADFAELEAWRHGSFSRTAFSKALVRLDDHDYTHGVPEEDADHTVVEDAYLETERRRDACRDGYPFEVADGGQVLRAMDVHGPREAIYKYLLLATRLDMGSDRSHADIDGTQLLERLAAEVAKQYLGARAESLVFGTASSGNFAAKVRDLCRRMGEGDGYLNRDPKATVARDGKLDVVAWKGFADELRGKLIAFGQCKTGTHYRDGLQQLQPDAFCDKWMVSSPVVPPVRAFFVAEALSPDHWYSVSRDAGLLFDRCRIVDFADDVGTEVLGDIVAWTEAAATARLES